METVEETTKDFEKEQENFINQKAPHEREDAPESEAVPPWMGLHEEEYLKEQIIELSTEKRNFLMDPPPGTEFVFDLIVYLPVAKAIMQYDDRLEKLRYELVPKQTKEYNFWRNYFYRVSLIKQSSQLNALSQQMESKIAKEKESPKDKENSKERDNSKDREKDRIASPNSPLQPLANNHQQDNDASKTHDSDFISDSMPNASEDAWMKGVKDELDQLGFDDDDLTSKERNQNGDQEYDWEKELAKELSDFETKKNESDWESEIKEILDD